MPLTRYRVRSEYGLADPELYRAADKDDPEALLEGVAMAGLVGVLRQLGDLAEFAAEIFHDLHEEVMTTSARGHGLMVRVQQLEAEFPPIEKALLTQTTQSSFFYNAGVDWHPNLRSEQNLIARGDLPRFVMDSYEESRGPPRLFLLDKFDVAGAGACLKRYTDPSFFKVEAAASGIGNVEIPRDKKNRRVKKKGFRWRNGETTPEVVPASHTKLHQLFLEERIENGLSDPARLVKLKKRHLNGSVIDSRTGKSYMEKFVGTPTKCETSIVPVSFTPDYTSESGIRILEISTVSPAEKSPSQSACSSPNVHEDVSKPSRNGYVQEVDDTEIIKVPDTSLNDETFERSYSPLEVQVEKQLSVYGEGKPKMIVNGYESDDMTSEVDNYMDALASMESEIETDNEYRPNTTTRFLKAENRATDSEANEEHLGHRAQLSDSQSVGNFSTSDDGNNSFKKNSSSFSYSDSPSSLVENTPSDSDGGAKMFPSYDTLGAGLEDKPPSELSGTIESLGATSHEHFVPHDTCIREENTTAHGEASSSAHSSLAPAASSSAASPAGSKTSGTVAEYIATDSKVLDTVENGTDLVDSIGGPSQVSSQINDDFMYTSERHLTDVLEDEDPDVIYLSNISELAPEKGGRHTSVNEGFEIQDDLDVSSKSLLSYANETPSITQKQLHASSLPDLPTNDFPASCDHSDMAEPDNLLTEVDDGVTAVGSPIVDAAKSNISEEVSIVDAPSSPGLKEQRLPDRSEDFPHLEPVSAEADALSSGKKPDAEVTSGTMDVEEMGSSRSFEHTIGGNVASQQHPSINLSDSGDDDRENLDHVVPETAEEEDAAIHSADFASWEDSVSNGICLPSDAVCAPSRSQIDLQEPLIGSVVPDQKEVEFDEGVSQDSDVDSETFREPQHRELASADLAMSTSISPYHDHSSPKICDDTEDLPPAGKTLNSLSVIDSTATSTSLDTRDQESELVPFSHLNSSEHATTIPISCPPEPEAPENLVKLMSHQVGSEYQVTDEAGPHPEFVSEQSEVRADRLHAEHTVVDQASSYSSSLPSEHMDTGKERGEQIASKKCINEEVYEDASLDLSREDLPSQFSKSEFPSISAGQEVNHVNLASNPINPALPSTTLVPEASQVDLGELPPLPPLPPMQWRMGFGMGIGKFQHNPFEGSRSLFPAVQPSRGDDKAQVELPSSQDGIWQPQNPSFPVGEDEKSLHYADPVTVYLAQPPPFSMHVPMIANDDNIWYNYTTLDEPQSLNPFLTLPAISSERHGHDHLDVEGEIVRSSSSSFSPEPTSLGTNENHDMPHMATQPLNPPGPEAGLDATTDQQSLQHSEGEQGNPVVTSKPHLATTDGQVRLGLLMPEGETTWLSNNSGSMPDSEAGKPNGNSVNKLPRPRNPLIDAVNAHGKSKLRKVAERVRPQLGPKADERDSLLEQIRARSFNLKPAVVTRSSIPGPTPKTNLKVAAILEKANAIRQALAGSDDEDDEDNWE